MRVVWLRAALDDLDRIQAHIIERSPRGAERIWLRVVARVADQAAMPFAAPMDGDGPLRRLVVSGTPYLVLYEVLGDELRIEAVFHSSRMR